MALVREALPESARGTDTLRVYESGAALALCVVAMGGFWLHAHFLAREPVDDAGISVAYARSLVEGHGFRVTHESGVAEGYSNPSWTLILIVLETLGTDSLTFVRPLGVAFAALSLPLIMCWGSIAGSRRLRLEDALGPLIAAAHPSFVHWAQGGLEMGLQVFGIALLAALGLGAPTPRRGLAFGATGALVILTRPEGALYAAAAGSSWVLRMLADRRRPGRADLGALLAGGLPVLGYLAFRRCYFGEWLPNTYFAKQTLDFDVRSYFDGFFQAYGALCSATLWALPCACLGRRGSWMTGLCNMFVLAALSYFAYYAKGDWMREWRFLAALAPFQGAALGAGVSGIRDACSRVLASPLFDAAEPGTTILSLRHRGVLALLRALPTVCLIYALVPAQLARSEPVRLGGSDVPITIAKGKPFEPVEQPLAPFKMSHPLVMASDMGAIALGMRHAELWDFAGLTDVAMARHFNNLGPFEDYLVHEGPPALALAWGPGRPFHHLRLAAERYDEFAPNHFLLKGLTPDEDPRCPGGKRATLALEPRQLFAAIEGDARRYDPVRALAHWRCAHAYQPDHALPTLGERAKLGELARALAVRAMAAGKRELALRYYSLCAVIGIHDTRLSVGCRARAEPLRAALF